MRTKQCAGCRKESCNGCRLYPGGRIHSDKENKVVLPKGFAVKPKEGFGLVFDIGTTTLAAMLISLETGEAVEAQAMANPQKFAGSDVASRITYCMKNGEQAQKLQRVLVEAMDELAQQLLRLESAKNKREVLDAGHISNERQTEEAISIKEAMVAGNTAMCEIFLGLSLLSLAGAPFQKGYQGCVKKKGTELGFAALGETVFTVLPAIEGYVGADALAVFTYIREIEERRPVLAVDIGTNGEILLLDKEKTYACSAAAGPALEGAAAYQGMRAVPGAVETVTLAGSFPREDIYCKVIGGGKPIGICGSGLLDALALLRKLQVIDKEGYLRSRKEAAKAGVSERICRRILERDGEHYFLLTTQEAPVYLTGTDVRQLQLAKGAIRGAVDVLLQKADVAADSLAHIYLAGAFGSYMNSESAKAIGLLPDVPTDKISHVGNCAGSGAVMALLYEDIRREMEQSAIEIVHVELAGEEIFQKAFLTYMALP